MTSVWDHPAVQGRESTNVARRRIDNIVDAVESLDTGALGVYISRLNLGDDIWIGAKVRGDDEKVVMCEIAVKITDDVWDKDILSLCVKVDRGGFELDNDDKTAAAQVTALLLSRLTGIF